MNEEQVRGNWKHALDSVDYGEELSSIIGWGLGDDDLSTLASIYKDGEIAIKQKIENLLTDCNFHTECKDFMDGQCEKYVWSRI